VASLRELFADTRPLRQPDFRRLWSANIVTVIGAQLTVVAVPAQIYALTGSSAFVGLTGLFGLVPLIVFGLWGGALADHLDRRSVLIVTTLGLVVTSALFWLEALLRFDNVWLLLGNFALQQAFFAINQPTRTAILPKLLPSDQLASANALNMTVMSAGAIAGPLVGGALIPVLGFAWLYLIDALTLFATLYAVVKLPRLAPEGSTGRPPGLRSVVEGLGYLRGHPVLLMSFVVDLIAMVFGMPRALFPAIAATWYPSSMLASATIVGLLSAAPAVGAVVSSVLSGPLGRVRRQGLAVFVSILCWGGSIATFGLTRQLWLGLLMLAVAGAADNVSAIFRTTILQAATPDEYRGRLQGIFTVVVAGGPRFGDVEAGGVAALTTEAFSVISGGVLCIVGAVALVAAVPTFLRYDAQHPEP